MREASDGLDRKNAWNRQVIERLDTMYAEQRPEAEIRDYKEANWDKVPASFKVPK